MQGGGRFRGTLRRCGWLKQQISSESQCQGVADTSGGKAEDLDLRSNSGLAMGQSRKLSRKLSRYGATSKSLRTQTTKVCDLFSQP
jgi:hypothetical protein